MRRVTSIVGWATMLVVLLAVVGCGGASGPALTQAPGRPSTGQDLGGPGSGDVEEPGEGNAGGEGQVPGQPIAGPLVVYTGSMAVEVSDMRAAVDQATGVVTGLGGYVASSREDNSVDNQNASVTYRIPAPNWTQAVTGIRAVAQRVIGEDTSTEDVTNQVIDLDARIANLRSTEAALQQIMTQATTIPDVLTVQEELTSVRSEIESMTAQRDQLADRAAMGTLRVDFLIPTARTAVAAGNWDLGREVDRAVATLVRAGQGLASLAVWVLIVVVPLLVPVLIAIWIGLRLRRRYESRREEPGTPAI